MTTIETLGTSSLRFQGSYLSAFSLMRRIIQESSGKVIEESMKDGMIKAKFKYGMNPFGVRILVTFGTSVDGWTDVSVQGRFADAFDTTGAASDKADDIARRFSRALAEQNPNNFDGDQAPRKENLPSRGKSKTTAALLALFLGGLGAHRFYLGSWGIGIAYLTLLFTPGLGYAGVILGVVEAVRLFKMNDAAFDDAYNFRSAAPFRF